MFFHGGYHGGLFRVRCGVCPARGAVLQSCGRVQESRLVLIARSVDKLQPLAGELTAEFGCEVQVWGATWRRSWRAC